MSPQETPPALKIMDEPVLRELLPSAHSSGVAGGIYHTRSRTLPPQSSIDARILHRHSQPTDTEIVQDIEEGDDWRDGQEKQKQVFKGWTLLWYVVMSLPLAAPKTLTLFAGSLTSRSALSTATLAPGELYPSTDVAPLRTTYVLTAPAVLFTSTRPPSWPVLRAMKRFSKSSQSSSGRSPSWSRSSMSLSSSTPTTRAKVEHLAATRSSHDTYVANSPPNPVMGC